jgi:uncharacterized protein (TIGR03435 family)
MNMQTAEKATSLMIAFAIINAPAIGAQSFSASSIATRTKFEVASVKACNGAAASDGLGRKGGARQTSNSSPVTLNLPCMPARFFINLAYIISNARPNDLGPTPVLEGGPAWIDSDRYQITAKAMDAVSKEAMNGPMLRTLLEERFRLKIHSETREVPIYELTVAKGGLKLAPSKETKCITRDLSQLSLPPGEKPWCGLPKGTVGPNLITEDLPGGTMAQFAQALSQSGRMIVDKTGVTGQFDFHVEYSPDRLDLSSDLTSPSLDSVLAKLGLKLERGKGHRDFIIIDHVEKPSEN